MLRKIWNMLGNLKMYVKLFKLKLIWRERIQLD